jgi:hypothetical protein
MTMDTIDAMMWWSVVTETPNGQVNVIGPFLLEEDALSWANRWMGQGLGRAGIAGLLEPEDAAGLAGFEWLTNPDRV